MSLPDPSTAAHQPGPPADGTADFLPAAPLPVADVPPTVPGYDLLAELGRGGMGVVYRARHLALNRPVALKMVLAGAHAPADQLVRFLHEAELLARVQHPNVVAIYDVGRHDGLPYFALEFCPDGTLAHKLAGTPLPARDAATLAATLARAVQAAHDVGVIHRDLKPGNVLLDAAGTPKLADFGLARFAELTRHLTQTGQVMGTPSYMAPEQAAGKAVGPLADVYALGAMLYCFLTGRPPHQAATPHETILQVLREDPAAPRSLVPGLPRDLETIALKALHKQPERRYATAAALAEDLDRWLAGEPIAARPASSVERAAKWARRRPTVATLAAAGMVALTAFVAVLTVANARLSEKQSALDERDANLVAVNTRLNEQQKELDGKVAALFAKAADLASAQQSTRRTKSQFDLSLAQAYWERGSIKLARKTLDDVASQDRHWEWNYFKRMYDSGVTALAAELCRTNGSLSPDGNRCAVSLGNEVSVCDAVTGRALFVLSGHADTVWNISWSPDGTHIVTASSDGTAQGLRTIRSGLSPSYAYNVGRHLGSD